MTVNQNRGWKAHGPSVGRSAFTLAELLTTLAIIALLVGMSVPAFISMKAAMDIKKGAEMVTSQLDAARQAARTLNRQVEVRFYTGATGCGELQVFVLSEQKDQWTPWTKKVALPESVEITGYATYSTLFGTGTSEAATDSDGRDYRFFRFLADGSTDLGGNGYPTMTVMLKRDSINLPTTQALPPNFIVIQVDPQTSNIKNFQPT